MFIIDAHLDLSMNALEWNRNLAEPVSLINDREAGMMDKPDRGRAVVSLPELRKGNIGLVVATQIARYAAPGNPFPGWHSPEQAWAQTQGQLAWYRIMEEQEQLRMIYDRDSLDQHLKNWNDATNAEEQPIGYILSLEGADSLINMDYLNRAYEYGLRAVGPAHYGPGRYAYGTDASAPLSSEGKILLKEMCHLGMILDATHLCDAAFFEAVDMYNGPVWASHNNCRALVNHNRQFSDEMIRVLIDKGAVIGGALDAWMMVPDWVRGTSTPQSTGCKLETLIDHLDHICQIAGNCNHIGIGTDLDGGFGKEQCPADVDSIADLQKLPDLFRNRGYREEDVEKIMHGNWLALLYRAWS